MASYESGVLSNGDLASGTAAPSAGELLYSASAVQIMQRVWSTGLSKWCYYSTTNEPESNPNSSTTSPNWTGSINSHQILARITIG